MNDYSSIGPAELKHWLGDGNEIALLDVREAGEFAAGHPLFASSAPLSLFEALIVELVPSKLCRLVILDDGVSNRAGRAAGLAKELGYSNIHCLEGGAPAWKNAGFTLFEGVYVPSKAFGELAEHTFGVPHISAITLNQWMQDRKPVLIIDGRPFVEHRKMNIPGSVCVPNGELVYRLENLIDDDTTPIVVHCAGRTRSIVGAQILRESGVKNPVFALENGTQGWTLAGLKLEYGSTRRSDVLPSVDRLASLKRQSRAWASQRGVSFIEAPQVNEWASALDRTTYFFDVRSSEEYEEGHIPGAIHVPGGQLLQSTDQWAAVRGARIVLIDNNEIRAVVVARWLKLMGWECYALSGGKDSWPQVILPLREHLLLPALKSASFEFGRGAVLLDTRPSMAYRAGHIAGAIWTLRCHLPESLAGVANTVPIVLCGSNAAVNGHIAKDLAELGYRNVTVLFGNAEEWKRAGLSIVSTATIPPDEEAIDFVFFTHDRHDGNMDAAKQYLAWETGLVERLDPSERAAYRF